MIYLHVPYCHRKCTYCAFYSKPSKGGHEAYVDALLAEMRERCGEQNHPVKTVYFGGGTPSILSIGELDRIVRALRDCFDLSQVEEVTLEANPEDLTLDYLHGLNDLQFFNRLSIGIQSLDDEMLRLLNRRHTAQQAMDAVENAYSMGFRNISVDFIYGLPSFSPFTFHLTPLISHVSAYALSVEPDTALARQVEHGRVVLPAEEEVIHQYYMLRGELERHGFEQYEVSNYCRPGMHSRHNSHYWDGTSYLGLGPSAHSYDGISHRRWNDSNVAQYILGNRSFGEEELSVEDRYNEMVMTALRTVRGLNLDVVPQEHKKRLQDSLQPFVACGWLVEDGDCYRPTAEGLLHADGMAADLFI